MAERATRRARRSLAGLTLGVASAAWLLAAVQAASAQELDPGSVVRFEGERGTELALVGHGRYAGHLELRATSPGIVVNELGIEDYVAGIDEMPARWHPEALRAQAIAARTYAWYSMGLDSFDGYDLCATTACQVYRGIGAVADDDPSGRWLEAVEATAGQVLVHDDRPILARYFSTSGGRTVGNEVAFPSSGPRPYLVGIDDPYDASSPYHRWEVRFTRDEFDILLGRGDTLSAAVPVAEVERVGDVDDPGASVRVTGQDGAVVEVGARAFREFVSRFAPDSFPDRFPGRRADGLRPLPATMPSSRFAVEVTDDEVVLHGRGWGHAVGLGQYGANARAQDGHDHREILGTYYNGLVPVASPDLPDTIRVGLEVAGPHEIRGTGWFSIVVDGEVVAERALGTWTAVLGDAGWQLAPPDGHGAALEVSATRLGTDVSSAAGAVTLEVEVNKPALLRVSVTDADGGSVAQRELGAVDGGSHVATWRAVDAEGEPLPDGDYRVALMAEDATGATGGEPVTVTVGGASGLDAGGDGERSPDAGDETGGAPTVVVGAAVAFVLALVILGVTTRRRSA